ncbi:hypothetical protein PoB_007144500 [Plakobranchus ocellatus]|uniref:Uncharacterized protein n=1 Tax=Plakobranchus ocellatus TaxID=259542 RepID=A0AAV4DLL4_9GAST|nr:hypothetical protein PoB_007144500 [Plakobranchus ocellatus]
MVITDFGANVTSVGSAFRWKLHDSSDGDRYAQRLWSRSGQTAQPPSDLKGHCCPGFESEPTPAPWPDEGLMSEITIREEELDVQR